MKIDRRYIQEKGENLNFTLLSAQCTWSLTERNHEMQFKISEHINPAVSLANESQTVIELQWPRGVVCNELGPYLYPEPVVFQWQSSGNPVCLELRPQCTLECHWINASVLPVVFQWLSSGFPVVFQCVPICKLTLDRHWDTTGYKHQPVWFQWHPSVLVAPVVF